MDDEWILCIPKMEITARGRREQQTTMILRLAIIATIIVCITVENFYTLVQLNKGYYGTSEWLLHEDISHGPPQVSSSSLLLSSSSSSSKNRRRGRPIGTTTILPRNHRPSPACLPFRYYNNDDKKGFTGGTNDDSFYEEFWKDKTIKRPTTIKMLHMRKSGGTSLWKYLQRVVRSNATSFETLDHCEGEKSCLDMNAFTDGYHHYYHEDESNTTLKNVRRRGGRSSRLEIVNSNHSRPWDETGSTFYVTHIREPVARALSHYKYSQRFRCPLKDRSKQSKQQQQQQHSTKTTTTLEQFVKKPDLGRDSHVYPPSRSKLWICSSNCYARWATGIYNPRDIYSLRMNVTEYQNHYPTIHNYYYETSHGGGGDEEPAPTDFAKALSEESLKLLMRYDLIIVLEWLHKDPEYARTIEDVFFGGVRGITEKHEAWCASTMQELNTEFPLEVSDETKTELTKSNTIDSELYRTLTACEPPRYSR